MSIVRTQEDGWTKEMAKWEARPVLVAGTYVEPIPISQGGHKDWPFQRYPLMLYKAESANGGPRICDSLVVQDEAQERIAIGRGWSDGQEAAIARVHDQHLEFAKLAAERAATERWMSGKAREQAQAIDEATIEHVPVIPETPIVRKRKYERKAKPSKTAEG